MAARFAFILTASNASGHGAAEGVEPQSRPVEPVRMVATTPGRRWAKIGGTDGLEPDDVLDAGFARI